MNDLDRDSPLSPRGFCRYCGRPVTLGPGGWAHVGVLQPRHDALPESVPANVATGAIVVHLFPDAGAWQARVGTGPNGLAAFGSNAASALLALGVKAARVGWPRDDREDD